MPGSCPDGPPKGASDAGSPRWRQRQTLLPTKKVGMLSHSIRSKAAISKQRLRSFRVRTPYSRTIVNEIREIPFARWDADRRLWTVPYRSFDELCRRWPAIEAAAARNEPEVRQARREALKGTDEEKASKARLRERRRKRYPVPSDDVAPFERAISTHAGVIIFTGTDGELADPVTVNTFYFPAGQSKEHIWASWRPGSLEELVTTWPARTPPGERERARGWWLPDLDELRIARRKARSKRRTQQRRQEKQDDTA